MVQVDFSAYALSIHKQNALRITKGNKLTLTEFAPSPYFSITNVHLVDNNKFAKCDEIPSLSVQNQNIVDYESKGQ